MATPVSDTDEPTGWIAFQVESGSNSFWLETKNTKQGILTESGWTSPCGADDPSDWNFSPIKAATANVVREYAGINSSGGPQVAGRADYSEFEIVKTSDSITPILYQFVSTGEAFKRVLIVLRENEDVPRVEWLLEGVNLTSYEFAGTIDWSTAMKWTTGGNSFGEATSYENDHLETYYFRNDKFNLLYTKAQVRVGIVTTSQQVSTDFRGWDTGTNTRMGDYPTAPPPRPSSSSSSSP